MPVGAVDFTYDFGKASAALGRRRRSPWGIGRLGARCGRAPLLRQRLGHANEVLDVDHRILVGEHVIDEPDQHQIGVVFPHRRVKVLEAAEAGFEPLADPHLALAMGLKPGVVRRWCATGRWLVRAHDSSSAGSRMQRSASSIPTAVRRNQRRRQAVAAASASLWAATRSMYFFSVR